MGSRGGAPPRIFELDSRADQLATTGYRARKFRSISWYPGRPLPTGPQFDADPGLRQVYVADDNRIPTYYTITGGTTSDPGGGGQQKLADYATVDDFTDSFEFSFHGQVHCNIGANVGSFFETSGLGYGSMCNASSPKDPMFWRWHGFIDLLYRNYCSFHSASCPVPSPVDPPPIRGWPTIPPISRTTARYPHPARIGSAPTCGTGERK